MHWPFGDEPRHYSAADAARYAEGFGAGLPGALQASDQRFLESSGDADAQLALPMIAVPLADGEFWQQNPKTGIVWQQMVHAGEAITVHRPLPASGELILSQKVQQLLDRGAGRGAVMLQQLQLGDGQQAYVTIDVTTVLRANGGFGGAPDNRPREQWLPTERPADLVVEVQTPRSDNAMFEMNAGLAVGAGAGDGQKPLRGVCSFGLAGRAALYLLCDNQPERLQHFSVRYGGMMFTDETMRVEAWHLEPGVAALRMTAVERSAPVLSQCLVRFK